MGSIDKRRQPIRDRISNLPNNVITHILSFLSTKDAVKTSALSTSWNQLWTLVPLLRFHYSFEAKRCAQSFVNFVDRVLLYNVVTPLDLFQLTSYFYGGFNGDEGIIISNWISIAISRRVRQIDVRGIMLSQCRLPDCLYSSKTLVVLKLEGNFLFEIPEKISFESLKIFHFDANDYEVGESLFRLIPSCPVLEELQITGQLEDNVKVLNISSLVLKRLRLIFKDAQSFSEIAYKLVLNTPNLQYFEHSDEKDVPDSYEINTLHCLDTARFSLSLGLDKCDQLIPERPLVELFAAISNVRVLYILQDPFVFLSKVLPNGLPKFDRLIHLELRRIESDAGLRLLVAFLQSSFQLEYLSFYLDGWSYTWNPPRDVPFCMIYNLKVIKVDYLNQQELLLNVLTYFLKKTNCLEELILHREKTDEELFKEFITEVSVTDEELFKEFIKEVSMVPRASNLCRIVLP